MLLLLQSLGSFPLSNRTTVEQRLVILPVRDTTRRRELKAPHKFCSILLRCIAPSRPRHPQRPKRPALVLHHACTRRKGPWCHAPIDRLLVCWKSFSQAAPTHARSFFHDRDVPRYVCRTVCGMLFLFPIVCCNVLPLASWERMHLACSCCVV